MTIIIKRNKPLSKPTHPQFYKSCQKHKADVGKVMNHFIDMLRKAKHNHDNDKFTGNGELFDMFVKGTSGKWLDGHVARSRHHLNTCCPPDVNLIDVLETMADNMVIYKAKGINSVAAINPQVLQQAFDNTVKLLNSVVVTKD